MATKHFYSRRFLNRRGFHAGAYVLADCQVDVFRPREGAPLYSVDATLTVADCNRIATLDFSVGSEAEARNALHKARVLREVVNEFAVALESTVEEWRGLSGNANG